jgi:hypothetical protein
MSRSKDNGEYPADFDNPAGQVPPETPEQPGAPDAPPEPETPEAGGAGELKSIEEHAEKLKEGKPILAAVMQAEKWAAGKKVTEDVFKTAVDAFLNGPMGGKKKPPEKGAEPPEGDKQ